MARRTFFSFNYRRDVYRVNQIRNIPNVIQCAAAGFQDASLWERTKLKSDAGIYRLIDAGLLNTTVTVVCIGAKTTGRKFINYEIDQSLERGNALLGLQIHHLIGSNRQADNAGGTPKQIEENGYKVFK